MSLADEVRTLRQRVAQRLAELEPLVREYEQLREVADELGLEPSDYVDAAADGAAPAPVSAEASPAKAGAQRTRAKSRRARSGAAGRDHMPQLLDVVRENPGATVAEIASIMDVPPTSLYRSIRDLTAAGEIVKRGRALFPAGDG
jgi:hypothetical protein